MKNFPLVTCIMPTKGRPAFARRAIEMFLMQDYPNKELVIVDDIRNPSFTNPPSAENITTVYDDGTFSIGEKRNVACEVAKGEYIAHWDDDDWHSPKRLSTQIGAMDFGNTSLCGVDRVVFYNENDKRSWLFKSVRIPWLCGGTLVYKKTIWEKNKFSLVSDGEDTNFVDRVYRSGENISSLTNPALYVAMLHEGNSTKRNIDSQWSHFDVNTIKKWMTS